MKQKYLDLLTNEEMSDYLLNYKTDTSTVFNLSISIFILISISMINMVLSSIVYYLNTVEFYDMYIDMAIQIQNMIGIVTVFAISIFFIYTIEYIIKLINIHKWKKQINLKARILKNEN